MTTAIAPTVGRPRSAERDVAILDAALAEYGELGFDGMSIEGVAARAGASKATVYRRYDSKLSLVAAALQHAGEQRPIHGTGSLERDLDVVLRHLVALTRDPVHGAGLRHLVADGLRNPELGDVYAAFVRKRRATTQALLREAMERGELRADVDLDVATDAIGGPIFYRHLVTHLPIDEQLITQVKAMFLAAFAR
ncbi:MAG: TetR/AcrR family transcriptional regulator [Acidimicrobiales bacterium]